MTRAGMAPFLRTPTHEAPWAIKTLVMKMPIGPAPSTSAVMPFWNPARRTAWIATASGSHMAPISPELVRHQRLMPVILGTGRERTGLEADIVRQMVQVFFWRRKVFGQASAVPAQTDKTQLGACYSLSLVSQGIVRVASTRGEKRAPLAVVAAAFACVAFAATDNRLAVV